MKLVVIGLLSLEPSQSAIHACAFRFKEIDQPTLTSLHRRGLPLDAPADPALASPWSRGRANGSPVRGGPPGCRGSGSRGRRPRQSGWPRGSSPPSPAAGPGGASTPGRPATGRLVRVPNIRSAGPWRSSSTRPKSDGWAARCSSTWTWKPGPWRSASSRRLRRFLVRSPVRRGGPARWGPPPRVVRGGPR